MSDYIKRTDLIDAVEELLKSPYANPDEYSDVLSKQFHFGVRDALRLIREMAADAVPDNLKIPSADVRENVHGKLIPRKRHRSCLSGRALIDEHGQPYCVKTKYEEICYYCSICGKVQNGEWLNFCDNCGADMRGDNDEL